jgi:hypothetical protein
MSEQKGIIETGRRRVRRSNKPLARKAPPDPRAAAKRKALNALARARRAADQAGVTLSDWEGEFLDSVGERLNTYGRAFADPDKGAAGGALSARQGVKLKEISAKARGEARRIVRDRPDGAQE